MNKVTYDAGSLTIALEGTEDVERALGNLKSKTPAAAKVAINATAREAKKLMIAKAKARYAVNAAGLKYIKVLKQNKRATNSDLSATLYINTPKNDLGYFTSNPKKPFMGKEWRNAPSVFTAKVLKESGMKPLTGAGKLSKGFLLEFKSGHVGMVQRVIGSNSGNKVTYRSRVPRWRTKDGRVEKLQTMGSPSATAMHRTIWPEVEPDVEDFLAIRLEEQVERVLARAKARGK